MTVKYPDPVSGNVDVSTLDDVLKAEDTAHVSGDKGIMLLAVRKDTAASLASADGDYIPIIVDKLGRLHVVTPRATGTDKSATATTTASTLIAANADRLGFYVKNDTTLEVWINIGGTATAAAGSGNIRVDPGGGWFDTGSLGFVPTDAVSIITTSGSAAVTAREY